MQQLPIKQQVRILFLSFITGCLLSFSAAPSYAVTFGSATTTSVGNYPSSVTMGDINRDGILDMVVANSGDSNVCVRLGVSDGTFGSCQNFSVGSGPSSVAVGDFDEDGDLDLVTANSGDNNVSIRLNTTSVGNGTVAFASAVNYSAYYSPGSVAVGDFDGDGDLDLAVANSDNNYRLKKVSVLLGTGSGTFASATNYTVGDEDSLLTSVAVGDLDGDGDLDLAVTDAGHDNASVLLGVGDGTFGYATAYDAGGVGTAASFVSISDLDQDGELDLAVVASDFISILPGAGDGTFNSYTNYYGGNYFVAIADFDGDGFLDLASLNGNNASILTGNGDGTFDSASTFSVGTAPISVAIGDFNRDGKPDVVTANNGSNNVSVRLNTTTWTASGDFEDADGSPFYLGDYHFPWGTAVGDFNGDGIDDIAVSGYTLNFPGNTYSVSILLGDGEGGFTLASGSPHEGFDIAEQLATGDFNKDGMLDLAVPNYGSTNVSILIGDGNGSFSSITEYEAGGEPCEVAFGDFDMDGNLDMAVSNGDSDNLSILLGDGAGHFTEEAPESPISTGTEPDGVVIADFDMDGMLDVAVGSTGENRTISIFLGDGDGTFTEADESPISLGAFAVPFHTNVLTIGDFDRDGMPDLISTGSSQVSILLGDGDGTFTEADESPLDDTGTERFTAVGDFNRDGKLDLAVTGLQILKTYFGDGDGTFSDGTLESHSSSKMWPSVGDFNRDGKVDLVVPNQFAYSLSILLNAP